MLIKNNTTSQLKRSICKSKPAPVLAAFNSAWERSIQDPAVVLQDEVKRCLTAALHN